MPRLALAALLFATLGILAPPPVSGQQGDPLGKLFLSFDPETVELDRELEIGTLFHFYVHLEVDWTDLGMPERNNLDGIKGWESCISIPPEVTIVDATVQHPGFNGADDSCEDNWIVLYDSCLFAADTPEMVIHYRGMLNTDATNLEISLNPASPSSIEGEVPGWRQCVFSGQETDLHPFASGPEDELVINRRVATRGSSWTAVKSRF